MKLTIIKFSILIGMLAVSVLGCSTKRVRSSKVCYRYGYHNVQYLAECK